MTLATAGRWGYALVAIAAWLGVVLTLVITAIDGYSREAVARPGMFGGAPFGWAGFGQRMIECLSYFGVVEYSGCHCRNAHRTSRQ